MHAAGAASRSSTAPLPAAPPPPPPKLQRNERRSQQLRPPTHLSRRVRSGMGSTTSTRPPHRSSTALPSTGLEESERNMNKDVGGQVGLVGVWAGLKRASTYMQPDSPPPLAPTPSSAPPTFHKGLNQGAGDLLLLPSRHAKLVLQAGVQQSADSTLLSVRRQRADTSQDAQGGDQAEWPRASAACRAGNS